MSGHDFPETGRVAGIDYGTVRIGVAVSDPKRLLASPLENYTRRSREQDARHFQKLVHAEQIAGFVIGLPIHASGQESRKSWEARQFGQWLSEVTQRPVCYYDERYTTSQASEALTAADLTKKQRKKRLDKLAAQIILAAFLERHPASNAEPGPLND